MAVIFCHFAFIYLLISYCSSTVSAIPFYNFHQTEWSTMPTCPSLIKLHFAFLTRAILKGLTLRKFVFGACVCMVFLFVLYLCIVWFCGFYLKKGLPLTLWTVWKCAFAYDRVWSSGGNPVLLTRCKIQLLSVGATMDQSQTFLVMDGESVFSECWDICLN